MVTRRKRPADDRTPSEGSLRDALSARTQEVEELRSKIAAMEAAGGRFFSAANHAIRNPLTVIQSYLEILHSDLSNGLSDQQLALLGIAYDNVMRLRDLIEDLSDIAALETHDAHLEFATVNAADIVAEACNEIQPAVRRGQLSLVVEIEEPNAPIQVDADRFKDVLRRILENAIRFTDHGGQITARTYARDGQVVVEVADTGAGIGTQGLDEIFQAFVQLHRKPGEQREGYGLGLAISRRLVEAFGGTLTVESSPGVGSTFAVRIPEYVETG